MTVDALGGRASCRLWSPLLELKRTFSVGDTRAGVNRSRRHIPHKTIQREWIVGPAHEELQEILGRRAGIRAAALFPIFCFYGPTEAFFDKTWALNDIEVALQ